MIYGYIWNEKFYKKRLSKNVRQNKKMLIKVALGGHVEKKYVNDF